MKEPCLSVNPKCYFRIRELGDMGEDHMPTILKMRIMQKMQLMMD